MLKNIHNNQVINSSPKMSACSSELTETWKRNLMDVSNISPQQNAAKNAAPQRLKSSVAKKPQTFKNRNKSLAIPKGRSKLSKFTKKNKENILNSSDEGTETASPCSAISEGTAKQMASVIRTGAWDHILMASDESTNSTLSSSFLSMARELGLEMSLLSLSTKQKTVVATTPELEESNIDLERFKRMQCEKIISELQGKLLETQQDLAVAKAHDHKKEQQLKELNQLLERVGASWQKMEQDSNGLTAQNEDYKAKFQALNQESSKLQETVGELTEQNVTLQRKMKQTNDLCMEQERDLERLRKDSQSQKEMIRESQEQANIANVALRETQRSLAEKVEEWTARETVLKQELSRTCSNLEEVREDRDKLKGDVLTLRREREEHRKQLQEIIDLKDNTEVELRRCGADTAILEVEHRAQLKQSLSRLQSEMDERIETLRKHQQMELVEHEKILRDQHQKELRSLKEELARVMLRLETTVCELETWKGRAEKLQMGRSQMLSKLQNHLQAQWSEAVRLLYEPDVNCLQSFDLEDSNKKWTHENPSSETPASVATSSATASEAKHDYLVPERDSSCRSSFPSTSSSFSSLQHYVNLLLKQSPRGQTTPTPTPTSYETLTSND